LTGRLLKLRRHVRWIAVGTALSGLAALLISLCQAKIYRATTYVLVSESKVGPAVPVPAWQVALLPTYIPFIDNEGLAARAIQHFQLDQEPYRLTPHKFHSRGYLDVEIPKSTRLIEISVEFPDAKLVWRVLSRFTVQPLWHGHPGRVLTRAGRPCHTAAL